MSDIFIDVVHHISADLFASAVQMHAHGTWVLNGHILHQVGHI